MKCTCSRGDLKDAIAAVARAVAVKSTTPVISGIYLRAEDNSLELQATNFQLAISAKIPANVESAGATVVIGKILPEIVNRLAGEIVTISTDESTATLKSDAATFDLLTMNADDFPRITPDSPTHSFRLHTAALRDLIARTAFAAAKDDARPIFTGTLVEVNDTNITFVATNTHRIAIASDNIIDPSEPFKVIIPATALSTLRAISANASDISTTVSFYDNSVAFTFDRFFILSRLIDGAFPPYDKVIPPAFSTTASLDSAELRAALERILILARLSDFNSVIFNFTLDGLAISCEAHDIGKSTEHVDADVVGANIAFSFNFNYILDPLKIISDKVVYFNMNHPLSPVKINSDNANFTYIVTPLRTQNAN